MGALPANLSIGKMIRVLALLCLAVLSMGEPEAEAKAVADPKADPYLLYGGYYGHGLGHYGYYGYPYGGYYYGKRSAKAEADPWYGYYGHGYGLGYYGYGLGYYGGLYGHYGYYGKRSAEAEPAPAPTAEAKADPYLLYGGYYGHGLGHYGYGYGYPYGYVYGK